MRVSGNHSVTEGVDDAWKEILDRSYTYHVLRDGRWGCLEDACDFADALVLGCLKRLDQSLLGRSCEPYWCSIS